MVFQTYLEAWADAVQAPLRNIFCNDLRGQLDRLATGLGGAVGLVPGGGYLNPFLAPLLIPPGCTPVPPVDNPVRGGQCEGVLYRVKFRRIAPNGAILDAEFQNVVGPVVSLGGEWVPDFFGALGYTVTCIAPNDVELPTPGIRKFGPSSYTDNDRLSRSVLRGIERMDGLPDTCGDGTYTPPTPATEYGPFTMNNFVVNIAGNDVTFGGTAVFAPFVFLPNIGIRIPVRLSINPNLYFPVNIDVPVYLKLPDLSIDTDISFVQNDIVLNTSSPRPVNSSITYTERIVGLEITCTVSEPNRLSSIAAEGAASALLVPWMLIVRFVPPDGFGFSESIDINVKTEEQYVPVPWWYGADGYTILPNQNVDYEVTEIRANIADLIVPV